MIGASFALAIVSGLGRPLLEREFAHLVAADSAGTSSESDEMAGYTFMICLAVGTGILNFLCFTLVQCVQVKQQSRLTMMMHKAFLRQEMSWWDLNNGPAKYFELKKGAIDILLALRGKNVQSLSAFSGGILALYYAVEEDLLMCVSALAVLPVVVTFMCCLLITTSQLRKKALAANGRASAFLSQTLTHVMTIAALGNQQSCSTKYEQLWRQVQDIEWDMEVRTQFFVSLAFNIGQLSGSLAICVGAIWAASNGETHRGTQ